MDRNRIKKLRKITVDSKRYVWSAQDFNCNGDYSIRLKIWENKKLLFSYILHENKITPKTVADIIKNL